MHLKIFQNDVASGAIVEVLWKIETQAVSIFLILLAELAELKISLDSENSIESWCTRPQC